MSQLNQIVILKQWKRCHYIQADYASITPIDNTSTTTVVTDNDCEENDNNKIGVCFNLFACYFSKAKRDILKTRFEHSTENISEDHAIYLFVTTN